MTDLRQMGLRLVLLVAMTAAGASWPAPVGADVSDDVVFEEVDGVVAVEAEHYFRQTRSDVRRWYLTTPEQTPTVEPDGDPNHAEHASGGIYLEALPDTRRTHDNRLVRGDNFSNEPGQMAVLHYKVHVNTPGRYYVWARIYSTSTEDNSLHVGLNGEWPESGQRMQWTTRDRWVWNSKQRTDENHQGERHKLYLDIAEPGEHTIQFSMREDGVEFDKWLMTTDRDLQAPDGPGPSSRVRRGTLPSSADLASLERREGAPVDGDGSVTVDGDLEQWHKVTLTMRGPAASERDTSPNPFLDFRMDVIFEHESGSPRHLVPGYFAADGEAGETSAVAGNCWRAHLSPDKPGRWTYRVSFVSGERVAVDESEGEPLAPYDGRRGEFVVASTSKTGRDLRGRGRLEYVGERYLRFAGDGTYFLKAGADAPETLLAYRDFDGTTTHKAPLKSWSPHMRDWREGDPSWQEGKGKGLIGAINYLADAGGNALSFLTYNAGGDGDNVWPFVDRHDKRHYDCSKLDQWQTVFDHAMQRGIYLHFKLQETENDDTGGPGGAHALDAGELGVERKLYLREMVARFAHLLALNWNLGEENTQTTEQQRAMATHLRKVDPYNHHIVLHTYPPRQERIYNPLLGDKDVLTGVSLQNNSIRQCHEQVVHWVETSAAAGHRWVVAVDEAGNAQTGSAPPDPGYEGFEGAEGLTVHETRRYVLWGTLMGGGAGVEYYFGYRLPQNDLNAEDWRSRALSWQYCDVALTFFHEHRIPFWMMSNYDELVGNPDHGNDRYCFAKPGDLYLVYLPEGGSCELDLTQAEGAFDVQWFNPREGGELIEDNVSASGGSSLELAAPAAKPDEDWLAIVRRR